VLRLEVGDPPGIVVRGPRLDWPAPRR
jgi:hypothetical protein